MPLLYVRLNNFISEIEQYKLGLLFVNDGSSDNTLNLLKEMQKSDNRISYMTLSRRSMPKEITGMVKHG